MVARFRAAACALLCIGIGACSPAADTSAEPAAPQPAAAGCGVPGSFQATLYGELAVELAWPSGQYECRGMPRPDGAGARLFFAGHDAAGDRRLAFILAIPAFERDAAGREFASTLTLIEEGGGRFFSTVSESNCVTRIVSVDEAGADSRRVAISGDVYCVSPLAEVNGNSSVSIADLRFTGLLDWGRP